MRSRCLVTAFACVAIGCGRLNFEPGGTNALADAATDGSSDGSVALDPCPTSTSLADDFDDGTLSIGPMGTWASTFSSAVTVAESQGRLVVTFPTGAATSAHAGVFTSRRDLSNACLLVAAPTLPASGTAAYAYLTLEEPVGQNPGRITIAVGGGNVEIRKQPSGGGLQIVNRLPHDPVEHAWWRLRTGTTVAWETSRDMLAWSTLHQEPAYFDLSNTQVVIGAGTDGISTNAGTAQFDSARIFTP